MAVGEEVSVFRREKSDERLAKEAGKPVNKWEVEVLIVEAEAVDNGKDSLSLRL